MMQNATRCTINKLENWMLRDWLSFNRNNYLRQSISNSSTRHGGEFSRKGGYDKLTNSQ